MGPFRADGLFLCGALSSEATRSQCSNPPKHLKKGLRKKNSSCSALQSTAHSRERYVGTHAGLCGPGRAKCQPRSLPSWPFQPQFITLSRVSPKLAILCLHEVRSTRIIRRTGILNKQRGTCMPAASDFLQLALDKSYSVVISKRWLLKSTGAAMLAVVIPNTSLNSEPRADCRALAYVGQRARIASSSSASRSVSSMAELSDPWAKHIRFELCREETTSLPHFSLAYCGLLLRDWISCWGFGLGLQPYAARVILPSFLPSPFLSSHHTFHLPKEVHELSSWTEALAFKLALYLLIIQCTCHEDDIDCTGLTLNSFLLFQDILRSSFHCGHSRC